MRMKKLLLLFFLMLAPAVMAAQQPTASLPTPAILQIQKINYAEPDNWAQLPPKPDKKVDVFYVYPTIYVDENRPYMNWHTQEDQRLAALLNIKMNTGTMKDFANIYAPFYRQTELNTALTALRAGNAPGPMKVGFDDVEDAFQYYLDYLNQGRPFILFGHSQGAMALFNLMKEKFDQPFAKKMIAAYLIGGPGMNGDLQKYPWLKFAKGETDTGVIITWNTQAADAIDDLFALPGTPGINPLNWKTDATPAEAELNLGTAYFDQNGNIKEEKPHLIGAVLNPENGALIVNPPTPELYENEYLGTHVYHTGDVSIFYRNIEANAQKRIDVFLNGQPEDPLPALLREGQSRS